jgi:hypothetical protein
LGVGWEAESKKGENEESPRDEAMHDGAKWLDWEDRLAVTVNIRGATKVHGNAGG